MKTTVTSTPIVATGTATALTHTPDKHGTDQEGVIGVSGTFAGITVLAEGQLQGGSVWYPIRLRDRKTGTAYGSGGTPTDSTATSYRFSCAGFASVRVYPSAGTPTAVVVEVTTGSQAEFGIVPDMTYQTTAVSAFGDAVTITASSATGLAVGPNGATNPTLQVATNVSSEVTGLKVAGAAAAAGLALTVLSSGTNEPVTIDAKGSGTISLGTTSTGPVYLNRGALKWPITGLTVSALGTTQNSTPTAAQLLGGVVTQTGATGAGTFTLPSGTTLSAALALAQATGDSFECVFANLGGGQTITITGATGTTVLGTAAVPTGKFARMTFVNTGSNTWNIYCSVSA